MIQTNNVATSAADNNHEQPASASGELQTAHDLQLLLKAAQHYAQKLDADQQQTRAEGKRTNYSKTISKLLSSLESELAQ